MWESLLHNLSSKKNIEEKLEVLDQEPDVKSFLRKNPSFQKHLKNLTKKEQFAIKALLAIQQSQIFSQKTKVTQPLSALKKLAKILLQVENFYESLGGIIGYHHFVINLLDNPNLIAKNIHYSKPNPIDLVKPSFDVQEKVSIGLQNLPNIGMIFPVGGTGDRLGLLNPKTKEPLPTALLPFHGQTLFEILIRDVQALEYLYYKTFQKQVLIPIVLMTSLEKNNYEHLIDICEKHHWFDRPKNSFFFMKQISIPVIGKSKNWACRAPWSLSLKPGGHGVIWKLLEESGALKWLSLQKKTKALIRQVNNPVAGTDYGLLALLGYGIAENKAFGFASCPRRVNTAEGVNVLREKTHTAKDLEYSMSSIEYTEFARWGIQDVPREKNSPYSEYPTNTNILFVDLPSIKKALEKDPLPGKILNIKTPMFYYDKNGKKQQDLGGRLELCMQNIADDLTDHKNLPILFEEQKSLKTFLTYNTRQKTLSTTKKSFEKTNSLSETPEGCFFDILHNHFDLFTRLCQVELPPLPSAKDYIKKGPSFITYFHPALGPLYSLIAQKIQKGKLKKHSELYLDLAELSLKNFSLQGSLVVSAKNPMGIILSKQGMNYSKKAPRCILENVKIINKGIDQKAKNIFWKNLVFRKETLQIVLEENAEFIAKDITFTGNFSIKVPKNTRTIACQKNGKIIFQKSAI
jgi:hypothetical protein